MSEAHKARQEVLAKIYALENEAYKIMLEHKEIGRNPLPLRPVFEKARKEGIVEPFIKEVRNGAASLRDILGLADSLNETVLSFFKEKNIITRQTKIPHEEPIGNKSMRHVMNRLEIIANAVEKLNRKPTSKDIQEAAENLEFEAALKKVKGMLGESAGMPPELILRVIDEVKPLQEPRKFAEMLKKDMEFRKNEAVVRQFARDNPKHIEPYFEQMFDIKKGSKDAKEQLKIDETIATEFLTLGEKILKRYNHKADEPIPETILDKPLDSDLNTGKSHRQTLAEKLEVLNNSDIRSLRDSSQYKGKNTVHVVMHEAVITEPGKGIDGFYTSGTQSCSILIAVSRDSKNNIKNVGMAHINHSTPTQETALFLNSVKGGNELEVYVIGGSRYNSLRVIKSCEMANARIEFFSADLSQKRVDSAVVDMQGNIFYGARADLDELVEKRRLETFSGHYPDTTDLLIRTI